MSVVVQQVSRYFGQQKALDEVSFEIHTGEVVGLLGPNGAGKSTLMRIITGYLPATSGRVFINGLAVALQPVAVRKQIGYLPEHNPLYPDMYVREYLGFVAGIYLPKRKIRERVKEMIGLTGLSSEQHKKIGALSKGYRQRVGLAQALIHDPQVLILDEPTSGLDPNQIIEIRQLIRQAGQHKTVILSTHIMQEVEAICDRVIIIHKGKIVADDAVARLANKIQTEKIFLVEFDQPVSRDMLVRLSFVRSVVAIGECQWKIYSSDNSDIRPLLARFAYENGLLILSLTMEEIRLEDIFHQLTSG
jgi:ABC-2 type transport system ATP-binding protein